MAFIFDWSVTFDGLPPDSESASQGALRIRNLKSAIKERMQADHVWGVGQDDGKHNKVTLLEQSSAPTTGANVGAVYTRDVSGVTLLFYKDSNGVEYSLTAGGGGGGGAAFPIGSIFISIDPTNPATTLGYGTWIAFASGRTLIGLDAGQTEFDTVAETGGEKTHVLSAGEMPSHTHVQNAHTHLQNSHVHTASVAGGITTNPPGVLASSVGVTGHAPAGGSSGAATATNQDATAVNQNAGGGQAHNNLPPYIVVYMWKRTA